MFDKEIVAIGNLIKEESQIIKILDSYIVNNILYHEIEIFESKQEIDFLERKIPLKGRKAIRFFHI